MVSDRRFETICFIRRFHALHANRGTLYFTIFFVWLFIWPNRKFAEWNQDAST